MTEVPLNWLLESNSVLGPEIVIVGNELGRVQMRLIEFLPICARGRGAALRLAIVNTAWQLSARTRSDRRCRVERAGLDRYMIAVVTERLSARSPLKPLRG